MQRWVKHPRKRKHSEEAKCLVVQKDTPQHIQNHNKSSQVDANQEHNEFWTFEVMKDMSMNKEEMTELLVDYVMAI
jgi:queuine/archaeosine tRNA-ribosyltransferase